MEDFVERGNLYELYGGLLKENQRAVYEYHVMDDMSFTEIGEELSITRQAAQELFRRADEKLRKTEETLGLQRKFERVRSLALKIRDSSDEENVKELAGEIINGI